MIRVPSRTLSVVAVAAALGLPARGEQASGTSPGTLEVAGGTLEYEVRGEGRPVVLIHGGLVDRRLWDGQVAVLASEHRVIRYDLRGLGRSSMPTGPFSHLDDLDRLLDELATERAVLVGLSLGGAIAMDYALEHPERVDGLVLAASSLRGHPVSAETRAKVEEVYRTAAADPERGVSLLLETGLGGVTPDARASLRRMMLDNVRGWVESDPESVQWPSPPTAERLHDLRMPTLVLVGDRDEIDLLEIADRLAAEVPRASKIVLSDAKHHLNLDRPGAFDRELLAFLRRLDMNGQDGPP